ncbi:proteasome regulatory subunit Rpn9 [Candidatus Nitrotoga sp. M5]|nr:proteasome regulatory subunit Rpn9 [Candidatus Nitrotoga sp. M5]
MSLQFRHSSEGGHPELGNNYEQIQKLSKSPSVHDTTEFILISEWKISSEIVQLIDYPLKTNRYGNHRS